MALALFSSQQKRRDQIIAIDLGTRTTKAVHLQRKGDGLTLLGFALIDAPIFEKTISATVLGDHLKAVSAALGNKTKHVALIIGIPDSLLRQTEMPQVPVGDLRLMLKYSSKSYLQQDLPDFVFDCEILPNPAGAAPPEGGKGTQKAKVLVGGTKKQFLDDLQSATKLAGLIAAHVTPNQVGVVNAFEATFPEAFSKEVVALVDLGFRNSSICILNKGELGLNRVVGIGGDKLTQSLSETMSVSYAEAEGIKVGLPDEVQAAMQALLMPLGRELRASIDFFEHQQDKTVSQVFLSGAAARSPFIIESLQSKLMVQCKNWDTSQAVKVDLPPQQLADIDQASPQLTVAIGGGIGAL